MNANVLRKGVAHAKQHAEMFDMTDWAEVPSAEGPVPAECGTTYCYANHIALAMGRKPVFGGWVGAELAELNDIQESALFYLCNWPDQYRLPYKRATTDIERALVLEARVEGYIKQCCEE